MTDDSMDKLPIHIRPIRPTDLAFVRDSLWRSHHTATRTKGAKRPFRAYYIAVLDSLLEREETSALVAVNPEDKDQILGWLLYADFEIPVIHYVYVKEPYRGFGLASTLLEAAGIGDQYVYTFTNRWSELLASSQSEHLDIEEYLHHETS